MEPAEPQIVTGWQSRQVDRLIGEIAMFPARPGPSRPGPAITGHFCVSPI